MPEKMPFVSAKGLKGVNTDSAFESMLSNYESNEEEKIKMVKKINNSFSNLNFQIDKLTEKQEITP